MVWCLVTDDLNDQIAWLIRRLGVAPSPANPVAPWLCCDDGNNQKPFKTAFIYISHLLEYQGSCDPLFHLPHPICKNTNTYLTVYFFVSLAFDPFLYNSYWTTYIFWRMKLLQDASSVIQYFTSWLEHKNTYSHQYSMSLKVPIWGQAWQMKKGLWLRTEALW